MDFEGARLYAIKRLNTQVSLKCFYHNVGHALDVARVVDFLAKVEKLDEHEALLLKTAAYYHDIGMIDDYFNHEEESVKVARKILPDFDYSPSDIEQISRLILVTEFVAVPTNLSEQIICDADLDYLGREDYFVNSERLRLEWAALGIKRYTRKEWLKYQIEFMRKHKFYTKTEQERRNAGKQNNIKKLRELLANA